ncbi:ribonuclease III [Desulfovibrio desulfuricans]|jgi:ribonuclease III, bacterial|uniref:ribonuclease III n=1 Tax=bioreactor metagenome TaxID=1076179 RepID=A0A644V222_9ZZZZ|nr:ribonuclease III [Desulfovibrio desulfuricans]MBD8895086.1 ribonuclease III [Desulfovibrio desulfuricans]MBT9749439.1 ribonuclease III [Desulfovibrio desulfuricans]MEA4992023.1 ribonuclease III [Desulfovibrio desulfuricans]UIA99528.1 ribonuclease III [Desulfovibrio desulfuricans]
MQNFDAPTNTDPAAAAKVLEPVLGYVFTKPALLDLALTHSSWANECGTGQNHNERLEFLGDAVLELCVSAQLYRRFPDAREGELTKMRAHLVSTVSLAERARKIGLVALLKLGRGEESQGGRNRDGVLSDALEAVLAAVYEDGGFAAAQGVVARLFADRWPTAASKTMPKDYKTRLQEASQQRFGEAPLYTRMGSQGPEHAKIFEIALRLPDGTEFAATGSSCKKAEQNAAQQALAVLESTAIPKKN